MADKFQKITPNKTMVMEQFQRLYSLEQERRIYKIVKNEAKHDLLFYLQEKEIAELEYDLEAPLYQFELKQCKTTPEIHLFMREFGWGKKKVIKTLNNDIVYLGF
jgi:hypothetical protein